MEREGNGNRGGGESGRPHSLGCRRRKEIMVFINACEINADGEGERI